MRGFFGFLLGVLFTYLIGALIAWDLNIGEWNALWRFICICFAFFWGWVFGSVGAERDRDVRHMRARRQTK